MTIENKRTGIVLLKTGPKQYEIIKTFPSIPAAERYKRKIRTESNYFNYSVATENDIKWLKESGRWQTH